MTKSKWILSALLGLCLAAPLWATSRAGDAEGNGPGVARPAAAADEEDHGGQAGGDALEAGDDGLLALEDDMGAPEGDPGALGDRKEIRRGGRGFGGHGGPRGPGRMGGMHRGHRGGGMGLELRELDLSASQRERIEAILERQQRGAISARAGLQEAALDLRKLMRDERPDRGAIDAQIDRISELRGSLMKSRIQARLESMSVLTDKQRDRLREKRLDGPRRRAEPETRGSTRKSDT